jgi:sugar/nucleoside kinase (ribokinase family)
LVKHIEFPYSFPQDTPEAKWVYLSSLASNSTEYHKEFFEYISKYPNTKLVFQPGTFQIKLGVDVLKDIYNRTDILFCNYNEAQKILNTEEVDKVLLMRMLQALGPKNVVLTDGLNGAYALEESKVYYVPVYSMESFESTGAGDAFASAMISAMILGKEMKEALSWGPINSMSVVSQVGAQKGLLTKEQIEEYLQNAKEDYKVIEIK